MNDSLEETLRWAQGIVSALQRAAATRRRQLQAADDALVASEAAGAAAKPALVVQRRMAAAQLKLILPHLQSLKTDIIDRELLSLAEAGHLPGDQAGAGRFRRRLDAWVAQEDVHEMLEEEGIDLDESARETSHRRAAVLQRDVECIRTLMLGSDEAKSLCLSKLQGVIVSLREAEAGAQFQLRLTQDVHAAAEGDRYSVENFAYGSTPFCSWLAVMQHPKVQPLVEAVAAQGRQYIVWGSSLGWLVFYGALTHAWSASVGYEILPSMVDTSSSIQQTHQVDAVEFVCRDMLTADISTAGLVMLASQCWDRALMEKAGSKLAAELGDGAIVVDYGPALIPYLGEPIAVVEVEVSWNGCQAMHVFKHTTQSGHSSV